MHNFAERDRSLIITPKFQVLRALQRRHASTSKTLDNNIVAKYVR